MLIANSLEKKVYSLGKKITTQLNTKNSMYIQTVQKITTQSYKIEKYPTSYEISQSQFRKKVYSLEKKITTQLTTKNSMYIQTVQKNNYTKLEIRKENVYSLENNYTKL